MHIFLENKSTLHYQKARAARKKISMMRGYQSLKGGGDKTYLPWGEWSPWGDKVTMDRGPPISPPHSGKPCYPYQVGRLIHLATAVAFFLPKLWLLFSIDK